MSDPSLSYLYKNYKKPIILSNIEVNKKYYLVGLPGRLSGIVTILNGTPESGMDVKFEGDSESTKISPRDFLNDIKFYDLFDFTNFDPNSTNGGKRTRRNQKSKQSKNRRKSNRRKQSRKRRNTRRR